MSLLQHHYTHINYSFNRKSKFIKDSSKMVFQIEPHWLEQGQLDEKLYFSYLLYRT